jgi:heme/copper-type cytochrome/quinol oxidase subunit 2
MQTDSQTQAIQALLSTFGLIAGIISIAAIVFSVIIYWRIFAKAGYSGAMGLLMFVPIANIIVLCVLAFGEWPIYRELYQLRQQVAARPPQYPQNPQYPQYR